MDSAFPVDSATYRHSEDAIAAQGEACDNKSEVRIPVDELSGGNTNTTLCDGMRDRFLVWLHGWDGGLL